VDHVRYKVVCILIGISKLPYILHDPRNGATLILLKYKLPYILHDPRNGTTLILLKTNYLISYMIHEMELPI
jgi:hypothetical protein